MLTGKALLAVVLAPVWLAFLVAALWIFAAPFVEGWSYGSGFWGHLGGGLLITLSTFGLLPMIAGAVVLWERLRKRRQQKQESDETLS